MSATTYIPGTGPGHDSPSLLDPKRGRKWSPRHQEEIQVRQLASECAMGRKNIRVDSFRLRTNCPQRPTLPIALTVSLALTLHPQPLTLLQVWEFTPSLSQALLCGCCLSLCLPALHLTLWTGPHELLHDSQGFKAPFLFPFHSSRQWQRLPKWSWLAFSNSTVLGCVFGIHPLEHIKSSQLTQTRAHQRSKKKPLLVNSMSASKFLTLPGCPLS